MPFSREKLTLIMNKALDSMGVKNISIRAFLEHALFEAGGIEKLEELAQQLRDSNTKRLVLEFVKKARVEFTKQAGSQHWSAPE